MLFIYFLFYPMSLWERLAVCIYMCLLVLYLLLLCCVFIEVQWMGGTQSTEHCPSPRREMWRGPTSSVSTVCLTCVKRTHLSYTPVNICKIFTCMPFYYFFFKKTKICYFVPPKNSLCAVVCKTIGLIMIWIYLSSNYRSATKVDDKWFVLWIYFN